MARTAKNAPKNTVVSIGHNSLNKIKEYCKDSIMEIIELEKERTSINARIAEIRSGVEAKGIVKKAFAMAVAYWKMSPEQRDGIDQSYIIARDSIGLPVKGAQLEFDMAGAANDETDEGATE